MFAWKKRSSYIESDSVDFIHWILFHNLLFYYKSDFWCNKIIKKHCTWCFDLNVSPLPYFPCDKARTRQHPSNILGWHQTATPSHLITSPHHARQTLRSQSNLHNLDETKQLTITVFIEMMYFDLLFKVNMNVDGYWEQQDMIFYDDWDFFHAAGRRGLEVATWGTSTCRPYWTPSAWATTKE